MDSSSSEYYWTASNDLSENKELVITSKIYPTQAIIAGMIDYAVYSYPQEFDIHSSTLNAEFIADNLILSSDVIELKGNPQVDEDYNDILTFIIKKAGRAVVIASYTRSDGVTIYSNAFVIETVYPYFAEEEYNFGRNSAEYTAFEEYEEENYRIITTTYEDQKTDLIEFMPREKDGLEDVEGYKLRLKYKYQNLEEIAYSSLNEGLYDFEIEIVNQVAYAVDDFAIIFEDNHPYLVTPKVSEKVYLKLKVTTKFGYKLSQTYNYVLQPDYEVEVDKNSDNMIEINLSEFDNGNRINLFDYLIENDEIINNGGKVFITNNFIYSNNCDDNEEHITGGGTIIKKIVYLPNGMEINEEDIPDGYEVKSILKLYIQSEIIDIDHNGEAMYIDDISQVTSDYIIGFKLFFWTDEDMSVPEIVFEGQIKIIYDSV